MFVASIKVDYFRNRQKYTEILQEIATQIPTDKIPPFTTAGVLELNLGGKNNRNTSSCPAEGAHFPYCTIYTGSYPYKQWLSSAVTPHHDNICASPEEGRGKQKSNNYKKGRKKNETLPKSTPKYWNWSLPSNVWFPSLKTEKEIW